MKKLSIILACILVIMMSCTKSKEVHPEIGDGNDEIVTVGMTDVHVEYTRTDHAELNRVVFHYCPADANGNAQQFDAAEMTKKETFFELVLDELLCDTLYWYYYELFPNSGDAFTTAQKTFHTQAFEQPGPPTPPVAELPTIVTMEVSEITSNSAQCGGDVVNDGGEEVTERGICWGTNENPNLNDNHIAAGMGTGSFTAIMNGLEDNTTYHVRAYATNEAGTAYGLDMKFTTLSNGGSDVPEGAINGLFTINENGDQVYFSQGNLQYQASTNTWRFAEHQWDYVGGTGYSPEYTDQGTVYENGVICDNSLASPYYDGWIDLFGWGTSGFNHGAIAYQPWSFSNETQDYYAYGSPTYNLYDQTGQADWGYNVISNGGNMANIWRTPAAEEWRYLFYERATASNILYAKATVNNIKGVILFPDDWNDDLYQIHNPNSSGIDYSSNVITGSNWLEVFHPFGCVFFPAANYRITDDIMYGGNEYRGYYWSSSYCKYFIEGCAYSMHFYESDFIVGINDHGGENRVFGFSVRLIQDAH